MWLVGRQLAQEPLSADAVDLPEGFPFCEERTSYGLDEDLPDDFPAEAELTLALPWTLPFPGPFPPVSSNIQGNWLCPGIHQNGKVDYQHHLCQTHSGDR